jgi:hypothetical protein
VFGGYKHTAPPEHRPKQFQMMERSLMSVATYEAWVAGGCW